MIEPKIRAGDQVRNVEHDMIWTIEDIFVERDPLMEFKWHAKCYLSHPSQTYTSLMWVERLVQLLNDKKLVLVKHKNEILV